jgi:hypothetical protein
MTTMNYRNVVVAESNFPGNSAVDFVLRAVTSTFYPQKDSKTGITVHMNLKHLIGTDRKVEHDISDIRLSAITNTKAQGRMLDRVYTVDLRKDGTLIMQVFVAFELDKDQIMTTDSHVWARLWDESTWKVTHYRYPIDLDNMSWAITMKNSTILDE